MSGFASKSYKTAGIVLTILENLLQLVRVRADSVALTVL